MATETGDPACSVDADCALSDPADLFELSLPARPPPPFAASVCQGVSAIPPQPGPHVEGPQCSCLDDDGNALSLGPPGLDVCLVRARDGTCLFEGSEFAGCDVSDARACDGVCGELHDRLEADAARTLEIRLLSTPCVESQCYVAIQADDACLIGGRTFDCSLTPAEAVVERMLSPEPAVPEAVPFAYGRPREVAGMNATVSLYHRRRLVGRAVVEDTFAGWSRFYSAPNHIGTPAGEVLDPLDPSGEDCGLFRPFGYSLDEDPDRAPAGSAQLFVATEQTLIDGKVRYSGFDRKGLDLGALGAMPRFDEAYAFEAVVAQGATTLRVDGPSLPEELRIETLDQQSRIERGPLRLSWTGGGSEQLYMYFDIFSQLGRSSPEYAIACRVDDDGSFTIPGRFLEAVPPGFVLAEFTREDRQPLNSHGAALLTIGTEWVTHEFALSAGCERPEVVAACRSFGAAYVEASLACNQGLPAAAELCPDYLVESCEACPEYFECRRRSTRCVDGELESPAGCFCP